MIQFKNCPVCSDGNTFETLQLAQQHELKLILKEIPALATESMVEILTAITNRIVGNSAKIVDILMTNASGNKEKIQQAANIEAFRISENRAAVGLTKPH